jgi:hypothetical protein
MGKFESVESKNNFMNGTKLFSFLLNLTITVWRLCDVAEKKYKLIKKLRKMNQDKNNNQENDGDDDPKTAVMQGCGYYRNS